MAVTNRERVGRALELLKDGLNPFVVREMRGARGPGWWPEVQQQQQLGPQSKPTDLDIALQLKLMRDEWRGIFGQTLGSFERNLVHEITDARNRWAHQAQFSSDDADRALDTISRLLRAVSAADQAAEVDHLKQELRRVQYDEQARQQTRRAATVPTEGAPTAGLTPWREIITPHRDVASGRYEQAEFAADLGQVYRGEGADEYRDPTEFFRRTFLTDGLRDLLKTAQLRLSGAGGDPIVELQTNFGGGKTHAMLALYHLCSGVAADQLPGIEAVLDATPEAAAPVRARRAVLVGTALGPGDTRPKGDGVEVHTLWGEMAWQIGGTEGYGLVAAADRAGVSPGSEALATLFGAFAPCLILIDEWVAFVRQLYGKEGLPAGSFDANLTFAQALTEAARQAPQTLLVASIPSSDIEIGGDGGRAALDRLRNVFGRMQSPWRPASAEEGFEIVRRRLFEPIAGPKEYAARDAVVRAFRQLYERHAGEFPSGTREGDYGRRLTAAYPIHPELFDRLYEDWSSLDRFQRTRGVLRLMASVIHSLWEAQDGSLLIMPATIPMHDDRVLKQLTHYLDDPWEPVIHRDVDGPGSLPLRLDSGSTTFGRYSAARRVARTVFLGSAPTLSTRQPGLDDRRIKLGSAQPGESVATFGDALRRLTDEATHLYVDSGRYWFSTQPSVTRLAQDRAAQQSDDDVAKEIRDRVRAQLGKSGARGDFSRVHPCPPSGADVPDERETRLVILDPDYPHAARDAESAARRAAAAIFERRGESPRRYRNALVFLAADATRLRELEQAVRQFLAWQSIAKDNEALNLDAFQSNQAKTKRDQADDTVTRRLPETYGWLLVPGQVPQEELEWQEIRLQGDDLLAVRAARKLKNDGLLVPEYAPSLLRRDLDGIPLWREKERHVGVRQLVDDFAQYPYLQRLTGPDVLLATIQTGAAAMLWETDTFAYAERWDDAAGRYLGLRAGSVGGVTLDEHSLVVHPDAARAQLAKETPPVVTPAADDGTPGPSVNDNSGTYNPAGGTAVVVPPVSPPAPQPRHRRFHGAVTLDPKNMTRTTGDIADAVVQHLASLYGAEVTVTVEIEAVLPEGAPEQVVRTVTENCRTLKFRSSGFEDS